MASNNAEGVRAAYIAMESIGWFVLVPLSLASLLSGLIQSFGTAWGLFRHYWVLFKLVMNVFATFVLLMYMQTLGELADIAVEMPLSGSGLSGLRSPSPAFHAGLALLVLVAATVLGVYKPRGMTRYGRRKSAG